MHEISRLDILFSLLDATMTTRWRQLVKLKTRFKKSLGCVMFKLLKYKITC